jgi:membrane protease YdiL (CAAX protease family)
MSIPIEITSPLEPAAERRTALVEVVLIFSLFNAFLWGGRDLIPGSSAVFIASMLALLFWLHRRSHESARDLGLRWDTFGAALRWLLPIVVSVGALVVLYSIVAARGRFPPWFELPQVLLSFVVSGFLQQYVLLGFFYRRLARLLPSPRYAIVATAAIFALLHLPNTFLTVVTFLAGILCTLIYRRAPNLFASGLMHGLLSFVLSFGLPLEVNDAMRVGSHHIAL